MLFRLGYRILEDCNFEAAYRNIFALRLCGPYFLGTSAAKLKERLHSLAERAKKHMVRWCCWDTQSIFSGADYGYLSMVEDPPRGDGCKTIAFGNSLNCNAAKVLFGG